MNGCDYLYPCLKFKIIPWGRYRNIGLMVYYLTTEISGFFYFLFVPIVWFTFYTAFIVARSYRPFEVYASARFLWYYVNIHFPLLFLILVSGMIASPNVNIFRVTGHLSGEFTKAGDAELWCFLWSAPWINRWVNNRDVCDLRHYCLHYDVIVMGTATLVKCVHLSFENPASSCKINGRTFKLRFSLI